MLRIGRILLSMTWLVACGGGDKSEGSAAQPAATPAQPAPAAPAAQKPATEPAKAPAAEPAPTDRIDDPSFELAAKPAGPYSAGKLGSFAISLTPRGAYHVNPDYPLSVSLKAETGLSLPKAELAKSDAATFGEKLARFDVPFTADKAGPHHVEAKVRFAVCTPENCMPDERTLALNLAVQ